MANFFAGFSQLSVNPNDKLSRQAVTDQAQAVAGSINQAAIAISHASGQADLQIQDAVTAINSRIGQLQKLNQDRRDLPNAAHDPGLDSQANAILEDLSQYANIQPLTQPDGTISVYLGGQTPLLVGTTKFEIAGSPSNTSTAILNADGQDVTSQVSGAKLGSLLDEKNKLLPGYQANLDKFATSFADKVNQQLASGVNAAGGSPASDLFSYDAAAGAAVTLRYTGLAPEEIAAADPSAPGGNTNALNVAGLADAKTIDGLSFSEYFGATAASFGRDLSNATSDTESQQTLLDQAKGYRQEISGVSLDQEAAELIQYQRAYQASAELFRVLNELTDTTLNLLR